MKTETNANITELTVDQKMRLLSGVGWWHTFEVKEAGLPALFMCDGPHGLRIQRNQGDHLGINESDTAVCYPTESTVACSFDKDLLYELGRMLGSEAVVNEADMVLGPGVNIKRTPLCGRNFEYYSEDPIVSGELGAAFVRGLQSTGVSACVKHFACNNIEYRRQFSDSRVDERTLREIYLKAFEVIVKKASPRAIMCAYNLLNGTYCSENKYLLTDILRGEWGYDGIVVSDWGAVGNAPASVKAGLNLEMPFAGGYDALKKAYASGDITEAEIDAVVEKTVEFIRQSVKNREYRKQVHFDRESALRLTRRAAAESQVLLKNDRNIFPIRDGEKILIVGDVAEHPHYQGGGSSHINAEGAVSLLKALDEAHVTYEYQKGFDLEKNECFTINVADFDKVIFAVALRSVDESEGYDRNNLRLPDCVNNLIEKSVSDCKASGVLLFTGGAVTLPWIDKVDGVMLCGLPGENGCYGVVDVLTGAVCPSGKLTETWVRAEKDLYTQSNAKANGKVVEYNEGVFVGYRYYEAKQIRPLFAFGHGLSYTEYKYSDSYVKETSDGFEIGYTLKNAGEYDGKETTLLFVEHPLTNEPRPVKTLLDFVKTELKVQEEKKVVLRISKEQLSIYDKNGKSYLAGGKYLFFLCSSAECLQDSVECYVKTKGEKVTELTLMSEIWFDERKKPIFKELIIDRLLPLFGLEELPENTERILLESPLKNFRGLAPAAITTDVLNELIRKLNEVGDA